MGTRILIFTSEFPPGPGGIGHHALGLVNSLVDKGQHVEVLADYRDMANQKDDLWDREQVFKVHRIRNRKPRFLTYFERMFKLYSLLKNGKYDCVIASGKFPLMVTPLISKLVSKRLRKIGIVHGTETGGQKAVQTFLGKQLKQFNKIVCVSNFTAHLVRENLHYENPIKVIPNGFDQKRFNKNIECSHFKLKGNPSLLTVGTISKRKGQHNVVKALPEIIKEYPCVVYNVIGLPRSKEHLIDALEKTNEKNKVIIHGALSDENLICAYKSADIFIMLSETTESGDTEGFGIALLEANYFGLPAIGSKGCGIEDAIRDGYNGKLVNPHNPIEIKNAITEILNNYSEYSQNAYMWAKEHTWGHIVEQYLKLLTE